MVARNKIWTPGSEVEELAEEFRQETRDMLEKIALENNVPVESLKFTVDNQGIINVQNMTEAEMKEAEHNRLKNKFIRRTMKAKGN